MDDPSMCAFHGACFSSWREKKLADTHDTRFNQCHVTSTSQNRICFIMQALLCPSKYRSTKTQKNAAMIYVTTKMNQDVALIYQSQIICKIAKLVHNEILLYCNKFSNFFCNATNFVSDSYFLSSL